MKQKRSGGLNLPPPQGFESPGERLCWSDVGWAVKDRKPEVLNA